MRVKSYKLQIRDLIHIYGKGRGGRKGHLIKILPATGCVPKKDITPGAEVAKLLHISKSAKKHSGIRKTHFTFEVRAEDELCTFYIWVEDEHLAKKVKNHYSSCYNGVEFVDDHNKSFPNVYPRDLVCCARLTPTKANYYPINIVEEGTFWTPLLNALQPDNPSERAVIQFLIRPKPPRKMRKARAQVLKRQSYGTSPKYDELLSALKQKAGEQPFEVVIRAVFLGGKPRTLQNKVSAVLSSFNRLDSSCGGNEFKRKLYSAQHVKFLNAVEDRNTKIFMGTAEERFLMGATQLGHNFLALPTRDIHHLNTLSAPHLPVPPLLLEKAKTGEERKIPPLLLMEEMSGKELEIEYLKYLKAKEERMEQEALRAKEEADSFAPVEKEIAEKTQKIEEDETKRVMYR